MILHCSFCGKSQHEVGKIFAGPVVFRTREEIEALRLIPLSDQVAAQERMDDEDRNSGRLPAIICVECVKEIVRLLGASGLE